MIELQDLSIHYRERQILHNLNAVFSANRITAIIGPSGCGKTTLLRAINRTAELQPGFRRQGSVRVAGDDIYAVKDPADVRRQIGMVLQKPVAFPLSIRENLLFGPRYLGLHRKDELDSILETTLRQVALWEEVSSKLDSPAKELSGGQLQRLSIGRMLAVGPKVLLLDEPCSSLDIRSTRMIEELLLEIGSQLTILIVTHNLGQAKRIAAESLFMSDGEILERNETQAFFEQPRHTAAQEFLSL